MNRADISTLIDTNILDGGRRTSASETREVLDAINDNMVFNETVSTTGVNLSFTEDKVYGSIATAETGNITGNVTNAKLGVTVLVIHNHSSEPTFDSKFKKLSGSGNYITGAINYIYCQYINATEIVYSIQQRT